MAFFVRLGKRLFIALPILIISLVSFGQTPIPGHLASLSSGTGGALLTQPKSVFVSGNYAYVASFGSNALEIIDITTPAAPTHQSSLTVNNASSVFVSGSYAYVTCGSSTNELQIIDVSDPTSPFLAGSIGDGAGGALLNNPVSVFVSGSYAYVASAGSDALEIIDVTTPSSPAHAGSITDGTGGASLSSPYSVFVSGTNAYVASYLSNALEIVDVATPASPVHNGSLTNGTGGALLSNPTSVFVSGSSAFVGSEGSNALEVIDITDPTAPVHQGSISNGGAAALQKPSSVVVSGNYCYVTSYGSDALEIVNISSPSSPTHVVKFTNGTDGALLKNPQSAYIVGNYAYAVSTSNALEVISIFDPVTPTATAGTLLSQTQFQANWNLVSNASGYFADVSTDNFSTFVSGYNNATAATNLLSVTGLNPGTTYQYRVRSTNANGTSGNSSVISVLTIPATPTATAATSITQSDFVANWSASTSATSYNIDVATDAAFTSFVTGYSNLSVAGNSVSVTGLSAGITYYYRVRAVNATGTSSSSNTISEITVPSNPTASAATSIAQTSFTANWSAVTGATGYLLDVATDAAFTSLVSGYSNLSVASNSEPVTGLTGGTTYYYRVRATNAGGASGNSSIITVLTIPAPPTSSAASSITQTSFTANWSASTGSYFLDVATDAAFNSFVSGFNNLAVVSISSSVTGLSGGTTYYFRVRASNASGTSGNSAIITVLTLPAAPVATAATTITQSSFTANWNAVTGAASYQLDVATDAAFSSFASGYNNLSVATTSSSVTGLASGTIYYYRVNAVNATGVSATSNTISQITIPADPIALAASSITQTSFTANWSASTGASGYFLDVATDASFTTFATGYNDLPVASTSPSITGLIGGTTYYYRVRSTNAGGTSGNSSTISVLTLPAAPVATAATAVTQNSFTANWNAVTGAASYQLDVATDAAFSSFVSGYNNLSVASTSSSVTSLASGTTYYYRVNAMNATGVSATSNTISQITIPADPTASAATSIAQTSFTANWSAVTGATGYLLDVATDAAFTSFVSGYNNFSVASTSASVTGLTGGTTYYYRVQSTNAGGTSGNSSTISTITIPAAPVASAATSVGQTLFTANWASSTGASGYFLDVATDAAFTSFVTGFNNLPVASTSSSVAGLATSTTYYYRVRATDASGTSGNSSTISATTLPATPSAPTANAASSITQTSFTANWSASGGATSYFLDVATDAAFTSFVTGFNDLSVASTSSSVTAITAGTTYYYRVRATNAGGTSASSNTISEITIPSNPTSSAASSVGQTTFTANWSSVTGAAGYFLDVSTSNTFASFVTGYQNLSVGNVTNYVVNTGLSPATTYYYRVRSSNAGGTSGNSSVITVLTISGTPVANAATSITQISFVANWSAVTGAASYELDVATDAAFTSFVTGYNGLSVASTSSLVTGLSSGTVYYYRVNSVNATGSSPSSNTISQITIPADPTASAATSIAQTSFTANWSAVTGATGYLLDVATDAAFTSLVSDYNNFSVASTSASVTGLTGGTTYYYRVQSTNAGGTSGNSSTISTITIPAAPVASAATSVGQTLFTANWASPTGSTGYFIDVSTSNTFATFVTGYQNLPIGNVTSYVVNSNISAATTYYYRIRASNTSGSSANSSAITVLTIAATPVANAATSITQISFVANWSAVTGAASYELDVATDAAFTSFVTGYNGLSVASTSSLVTGLSSGTVYYYRVNSVNATGSSPSSNTISEITIPSNPTATAATGVSQTSFMANWSAVAGVTSYFLDVATDAAFSSILGSYNNLSLATTSSSVTGLTAGTTYYYRVRAGNAGGVSGNSNSTSIATISVAPVAGVATSIAQTSFVANWSAPTGATGYLLDVATDAAFSSFVTGYNNLPVAGTSSSVTGLSEGATYYYRVRATNSGGTSSNSSTISVTTIPATPTATAATSVSQTGFTANWNAVVGATSYSIDVATDAAFTSFVTGYNNVSVVSTSLVVPSLSSGVTYYYRVRSSNSSGSSASSNTISQITIPTNPTATAASAITQTSFTANWNSTTGASGYFLDVATDNGFSSFVSGYNNLTVASNSSPVSGLTAGINYYYRVRATNAGGTSGNSTTISVITVPIAPVANAASSITQTSFTANWSAASGASGYFLDVATDAAFTSFVSGFNNFAVASTSSSVTGLTAGTTYYYRVRSTNANGTSGNSSTISLITVPLAPTANAATSVAQTSFVANWSAVTGASGYFLDVAIDASFSSFVSGYDNLPVASTLSRSVTGLTGGVTYYYRVRATNAGGTSPNSSSIIVLTLPGPLVAIAASSVTQNSFVANWSAVTGATSYEIDVATDSGFTTFVPGYNSFSVASNSTSVTDLSPGTTYYYQVRSVNGTGSSSSSNTISQITIPANPSSSPASSVTQTSFTANWLSSTGATDYHLDVASDAAFSSILSGYNDLTVTSTSASVTDLSGGTVYYYRVRASNAGGVSGNSSSVNLLTIPSTPVAIAATLITQTGFTANWNAMTGASSYSIDVATDAAFTSFVSGYNNNLSVASNSLAVTGLLAGNTYYYRVRAANATGSSASSNIISQITAPPDPSASTASVIGQTSFTANWSTSTGASGYLLDVATDAAFTSFVGSYNDFPVTSTSTSVTGLTGGTTYYYRVQATNAGGTSGNSSTIVVLTIPAPPVASAATSVAQTSFVANWAASTGATNYFLDVSTSNTFASFVSGYQNLSVGTVSNYTVNTNLSVATTYYYRVRAVDASGTSTNSSTISVLTLTATPVATAATSITQTSFVANWTSVSGASSYSIDVATDNAFTSIVYNNVNVGNLTSYTANSLNSNTTYYYRVTANNATGSSPYSNIISATTFSIASSQASNLTFSAVSTNSITVSFTPGNGSARLVVVKAGSALSTIPTNGVTYSANTNFGSGGALGSGFVVSNGAATNVTVTNLAVGTIYYFQVFEYTGTSGSEFYNTTLGPNNPNSQTTLSSQPSVQAKSMTFTNVGATTVTVNFTKGNGASRILVAHAGSTINTNPSNGASYAVNSFGNGSEIGTGNFVVGSGLSPITVSGLSPGTLYYFEVFEFNGSGGSENYNITTGTNLNSVSTLSISPSVQSSGINFTSITNNSVTINFTPGDGASHLVVASKNGPLSTAPSDGSSYNANAQFGSGSAVGSGFVVGNGVGPMTITGLSTATLYYFQIFDFNGSGGLEKYLTVNNSNNPANVTTLDVAPTAQPSNITFSQQTATSVTVSFQKATPAPTGGYIALRSVGGAPNTPPVSGNAYTLGATIGNAVVAYRGTSSIFDESNLPTGTQYFYSIYSYNGSGVSITYLTTGPAQNSVILDAAAPVISFPNPNPTTIVSGNTQTLTATVTDNFQVTSVQFFHRGITKSAFVSEATTAGSSNSYLIQTQTAWYDSLGMEYYFIATDENGNASSKPSPTYFAKMVRPSITFPIPASAGNGAKDYKIFSFPYSLSPDNSVTSVFPGVASKDDSKFRLLHYNPSRKVYDEYAKDEFSTVDVGKGYWILTSNATSATVNNATAPAFNRNHLDSIKLEPGWNQIGNPYPAAIKWSDVQNFVGQPSGTDTLSFYVYDKGWAKLKSSEKLAALSGGFVKNTSSSPITIYIPFQGQTVKGSRTTTDEPGSDISQASWQVDLNILQSDGENRIGGFGMAPNAYYGFDRYDDSNPPSFTGTPELSFKQNEVQVSELARSVVPTQKEYTWRFTAAGEVGQTAELVWNSDLGGGSEQLFLLDEQSMQVIDMRSQQKYSFVMGKDYSFKIFFGNDMKVSTEGIMLSQPFPNPAVEKKSNFMLGLPESNNDYVVNLQVFSSSGENITSDSKNLPAGIQQLQWQATENVSSGLYLYRITVSDGNRNFVSTGKIIIP